MNKVAFKAEVMRNKDTKRIAYIRFLGKRGAVLARVSIPLLNDMWCKTAMALLSSQKGKRDE